MASPAPVAQLNRDVEDDDVFMQLELPLEVIFSPFHYSVFICLILYLLFLIPNLCCPNQVYLKL